MLGRGFDPEYALIEFRDVQVNFDDALLGLYKSGVITLEEAMTHADSRSNLEAKVNFGG